MKMLDKYLGSSAFFRSPDEPAAPASTPSSAPSASDAGSSSPSPAASAPSPAPTSTPESPAAGGSEINFEALFGEEPPEPAAPAPSAAPPPKPSEPAPAPPAPATPEPRPAAAAPPKPEPAPAPAPTGPASLDAGKPPLDPMDPASLATHLAENETAMVDHLATKMFALSKEDMEELETDVSKAVPKLLARTFVQMQKNMLQQMARLTPAMVQKTTEAVKRNAEAREKFFKRWPALTPDKHGDTVDQYARTYRQMNPTASFEQMVEALGPIIMMAANVVPTPGPAAPAAPPKPQPFVPASAGATAVLTTPVEEDTALAVLDPSREY